MSWRVAAAILGAATVVGLLVVAQMYYAEVPRRFGLVQLAIWQLPGWYFWAAASRQVWRLPRLVAAYRRRAARLAVIALAAVVADGFYILVHTLASFAAGIPHAGFVSAFYGQLTTRFHYGLITFGAILAAAYAVDYGRALAVSEQKRARAEGELAEARLSALHMQLRPHFLFNTLNTVAMLVREAGAPRALDVVVHLSALLRRVIDESQAPLTTVRDEVDFLAHYLEIERVRFADRLSIEFSILAGIEDATIPTLLLQPIVENALRHGVGRSTGRGTVRVAARRDGTRLRLTVSDDGPGLVPANGSPARRGLGLALVERRLQQAYGDDYRFCIENTKARESSRGTTVTIDLPFRQAAGCPPSGGRVQAATDMTHEDLRV